MEALWTPSSDRTKETRLWAFMEAANVDSFGELHAESVSDPAQFWALAWDECGVQGQRGDVVFVPGNHMRSARFFPEATLNVAQTLLQRNDDTPAILFKGEDQVASTLSWADLHELTSRFQKLLVSQGVGVGDRVAAWLPNTPNIYALMLAATGLGAVFSSTSPDFSTGGVVDRFYQIAPKALFVSDGYFYNGKWFSCLDRVDDVVNALPSLDHATVLPYQTDIVGDLPRTAREVPPCWRPRWPVTCISSRSHSTTRGTSSTHQARQGNRNASCIAPVGCC